MWGQRHHVSKTPSSLTILSRKGKEPLIVLQEAALPPPPHPGDLLGFPTTLLSH